MQQQQTVSFLVRAWICTCWLRQTVQALIKEVIIIIIMVTYAEPSSVRYTSQLARYVHLKRIAEILSDSACAADKTVRITLDGRSHSVSVAFLLYKPCAQFGLLHFVQYQQVRD